MMLQGLVRRHRQLTNVMLVLWALLAPAACKKHQGQSANTSSNNRNVIRLLHIETGTRRGAIQDVISTYNASKPGVPIVEESIAGGGNLLLGDKVRTDLAAGTPPHLFQMWPGEIVGPFIDAGHLRPIDDLFAKYKWEDVLIPWTLKAVERYGHRWAVPTASHGMTFWYRKDIFARYGLKEPDTFAELEHICTTLRANNVDCISLGGKYGWLTMRLLDFFIEHTCGPEMHDRLNGLQDSWDRQCVVGAYELLVQWIQKRWVTSDFLNIAPNDARLPFYRGTAAMAFEGDWMESIMTQEDEQDIERYDFFIGPSDHLPRRFCGFAEMFAVGRSAGNDERVADFLNEYIQEPVQAKTLAGIDWSARRNVPLDPIKWPRTLKWRKLMDNGSTFPPTDQVFPRKVMDDWFEIQDGVAAGHISPKEGARRLALVLEQHRIKRAQMEPTFRDRAMFGPEGSGKVNPQ
jgi:raffinose/stachyose/melibiose transport system substrate-binding protein